MFQRRKPTPRGTTKIQEALALLPGFIVTWRLLNHRLLISPDVLTVDAGLCPAIHQERREVDTSNLSLRDNGQLIERKPNGCGTGGRTRFWAGCAGRHSAYPRFPQPVEAPDTSRLHPRGCRQWTPTNWNSEPVTIRSTTYLLIIWEPPCCALHCGRWRATTQLQT